VIPPAHWPNAALSERGYTNLQNLNLLLAQQRIPAHQANSKHQ
jgi:hypothetical protein